MVAKSTAEVGKHGWIAVARKSGARVGNDRLTEASRFDKLGALLGEGHPDCGALLVAGVRDAMQASSFGAAYVVHIC